MEVTIQDISRMTKPKVTEDWCIPMAILTMDSGKMIRHMDMANIHPSAEVNTKDIGKTTRGTDKGSNHGKTAPNLKAYTSSMKKVETENSSTAMEISISANSRREEKTAKES